MCCLNYADVALIVEAKLAAYDPGCCPAIEVGATPPPGQTFTNVQSYLDYLKNSVDAVSNSMHPAATSGTGVNVTAGQQVSLTPAVQTQLSLAHAPASGGTGIVVSPSQQISLDPAVTTAISNATTAAAAAAALAAAKDETDWTVTATSWTMNDDTDAAFVLTEASVQDMEDGDNSLAERTVVTNRRLNYIVGSNNAPNAAGRPLNETHVGVNAAAANTGVNVTGVGVVAASANTGANVTSVGVFAANANTGSDVVAVGVNAAAANTGSYAVAVGVDAGRIASGVGNVAVGAFSSLYSINNYHTSVGHSAGQFGTGDSNTSVGSFAGYMDHGNNNTAIGWNSAPYLGGTGSTAVGHGAFTQGVLGPAIIFNFTNGSSVVNAPGHGMPADGRIRPYMVVSSPVAPMVLTGAYGFKTIDANNFEVVGFLPSATGSSTMQRIVLGINNSTALGAGTQVTAHNQVMLGNGAVTEVRTAGAYYGTAFNVVSDPKFKKNWKPTVMAAGVQFGEFEYDQEASVVVPGYTAVVEVTPAQFEQVPVYTKVKVKRVFTDKNGKEHTKTEFEDVISHYENGALIKTAENATVSYDPLYAVPMSSFGKVHFGVMADDPAIPDSVKTVDADGNLAIDYAKLAVVIIAAQAEQIADMQARLAALEGN